MIRLFASQRFNECLIDTKFSKELDSKINFLLNLNIQPPKLLTIFRPLVSRRITRYTISMKRFHLFPRLVGQLVMLPADSLVSTLRNEEAKFFDFTNNALTEIANDRPDDYSRKDKM